MNEQPMNAIHPESSPSPVQDGKAGSLSVALFEYLELFAWAVFVVILVFTFAFRICRVDGHSMENTLQEKQTLLLRSAFYTPKQDDIIVFHLTNAESGMEKTLVKRVIAVGGQEVVIDTNTATITVDGEVYSDTHAVLKRYNASIGGYEDTAQGSYFTNRFLYGFDSKTGIFRATVPEGCLFVMGDNRNNSRDSRDPAVGFVDARCVLGKVILRFSPFTVLG